MYVLMVKKFITIVMDSSPNQREFFKHIKSMTRLAEELKNETN